MNSLFESDNGDTNSNFVDGYSNSAIIDNPNNLTETLLTLNRAYQEVVQEKINQLKLLLEQNRLQQAEVYEKSLSNVESTSNAFKIGNSYKDSQSMTPNEIELNKIKENYFKDRFNSCPDDNIDTMYKNKLKFYDYLPQLKPGWSIENRKKLKKSVIDDALRVIKAPLVSKKTYLEEKLLNFTLTSKKKDHDVSNVHRMLKESNIQLKKIDNLSESQILSQTDESKIDWMKISKIDFKGNWSFSECRLMWKNVCHSLINQEKWTTVENYNLIELARKYGEKNWEQVAIELNTNRSAYLCMKRYHEKTADKYCKRDWTEEETKELCDYAESTRIGLSIPFNYLCYLNGTRDRNSIYNWYLKVNPQLNHGKWLDSEKQSFEEAIEYYKFNLNWQEISEYVGTRTALQCKERYELKYQYPEKYINWTLEEDKKLIDAVDEYGTHWVKIAQNIFPKRTDHSCLFRYTKLMNWQKQQEWFNNQPEEIKEFMLFLFKRRLKDGGVEVLENHNVFTNKGELVPTLPKFGPGTRNLNNIIDTIYEKKDLVYEFIKKKQEGQLSIALLNKIGIFTPVLNSLIAKCKKYHNFSQTSKKVRVPRQTRGPKTDQEKKVKPKMKKIKQPKTRMKKLKIKDTLERIENEKKALNISRNETSNKEIKQVVSSVINNLITKIEKSTTSQIKYCNKINKSTAQKRKNDQNNTSKENVNINKKSKKLKLTQEKVVDIQTEPQEIREKLDEPNKTPITIQPAPSIQKIHSLPISSSTNVKRSKKINQILDLPAPILPQITLEPVQTNLFSITSDSSNSSTNSTTDNRELIKFKSKKSIKIADLINNTPTNSIVLLDVTSSTENKSKTKTRTPKATTRQLISNLKPIEKSKDSNKMIRDIVGEVAPLPPSICQLSRTIASGHSSSSITITPMNQTAVATNSIRTKKAKNQVPTCSVAVKFESIEDGEKIPCLIEQYNEFKYLYSLRKDSNTPKYFQKFTIIKWKDKLIAIKPVNYITDDWLTDEKMNAIEKTLHKVMIK